MTRVSVCEPNSSLTCVVAAFSHTIAELAPETSYEVYCFGHANSFATPQISLQSVKKTVQTTAGRCWRRCSREARLEVKKVKILRDRLVITVESSVKGVTSCVLFDQECRCGDGS